MVNLDNYEECDPEHPAACRAVVGKAIYTRWDHEIEGTEEWSYGGLPPMTRGGLCTLEAKFYKPKEKFIKSEFVEFNYAGCVNGEYSPAGYAIRCIVGEHSYDFGAVANRRYKITVEEL